MAHYIDASAVVKLVVEEDETAALRSWILEIDGDLVTSDLTRTELYRAARRVTPDRMDRVRTIIESLDVSGLPARVFDAAGRIDPPTLRSLDALHLAAALGLGDELDGIVTYDDRLADAAVKLGIPVVAPA